MRDSLRVLTWNTQLRSWAVEALADGSLFPHTTAEERAEVIAQGILASTLDYDVVCLNEVFDEDARELFVRRLSGSTGRFPYCIVKCTSGALTVRTGDDVGYMDLDLWLTVLGVAGTSGRSGLFEGFEDSGLMVLSRFPFVRVPYPVAGTALATALVLAPFSPIPAAIPAAWKVDGFPRAVFSTYTDTDESDGLSSKGVACASITLPNGRVLHLLATHTQADYASTGQYASTRALQLEQVRSVLERMAGASVPKEQVAIFCGDLNVAAGQIATTAAEYPEWRDRFTVAGSGALADEMVEVWGREQCIGGDPTLPVASRGLRDPGYTAPVIYQPFDQRLDQLFRNHDGPLVVQHLRIDQPLSLLPSSRAGDGIGYISDHKPLSADLHHVRAGLPNTPAAALPLSADPDVVHSGYLDQGEVCWYRFDVDGTYEFWVDHDADHAQLEVYLDTDLSSPWPTFRRERGADQEHDKYVLPSAPFLVKVFLDDRGTEGQYTFHAHRHQGAERSDAIELVPGVERADVFPDAQILGADDGTTPWDDTDTRWYRISMPMVAQAPPSIGASVRIELSLHAADGATVRLLEDNGGAAGALLDEQPVADGPVEIAWSGARGAHFFLCLQRQAIGGAPVATRILVTMRLNVLQSFAGAGPRLVCVKETSGWGSDDISWTLRADGVEVARATDAQIGGMDQDDTRDLEPWLPTDPIYFVDSLELEVREEDDISPDDVGTIVVPTVDAAIAAGADGDNPFRVPICPDAVVDDGRYALHCNIARWDPRG